MKTKQAYATLPHVTGFIDWLATELNSKTLFTHQYVDRRSGNKWSCDSLFGAYQSYSWNFPGNARLAYNPGSCSASNAKALDALRQDLIAAGSNDALVQQAATDVMAWGGVTSRNVEWLKANKTGLGRMIQEVKTALIQKDPDAPVLRSKSLRFNSGMTKIYSLICPEFLIYDSRVAAALGLLVVQYCKAKELIQVPDALCFPWAAAKESENALAPKRRNPSTGTLLFKRLRSGSHHAQWNIRASWVLSQVIAHEAATHSPFHQIDAPANALRGLEQSLFMVGYDLGHAGLISND
ncbi:hypothetical protein [Pseudomonas sp. LB3P14]